MSLSREQQDALLKVAADSIAHGLTTRAPLPVNPDEFDESLTAERSSFVTLDIGGRLRGCIGGLEPRMPLVADVAQHAFAAAFSDPRFPMLKAEEYPLLEIHISIIFPSEPLPFTTEEDLLQKLRPGVDGLIIALGRKRATFLPTVWKSLPNPRDFVLQSKRKAGIPDDAADFRAWVYATEDVPA